MAYLLRTRRSVLQPEDVGFPRGRRRRTTGLRREEVAQLCSISTAYYSRLERHCGPRPSPMTLARLARGLRFDQTDRNRLFVAAGYDAGADHGMTHVDPGVMLLLGRLADTPAEVLGPIGDVLYQTPAASMLFGDLTRYTGWERSGYYRWFTRKTERQRYPLDAHRMIGAEIVSDIRRLAVAAQHARVAAELVQVLLRTKGEFTDLWKCDQLPARALITRRCRTVHPELGVIELTREVLVTADLSQRVVVFLAEPGSESDTKVKLSSVIGHHSFTAR